MQIDAVPTRLVRLPNHKASELAQRVALFAVAMNRPGATELLAGFAELLRDEAQRLFVTAKTWPSSTRQARISLEFGARSDQIFRVQLLLDEASPALRHAVWAQLPAALQTRFPVAPCKTAPSPAMECLAARLVREATR